MNFNNSKGSHDMRHSILQTQSIFWWTGKQKKVFSEAIHSIDTHIDVIVEVLYVQSRVTIKFCIDD